MPTDRKVPMWVYLDGRVLQTDPALNFGYALSTESGELLYWSLTTDSATESWPRIDAAPLRLRSRIPATLLNEGTFRLELIVSLHFRQWIYQPGVNAPSIDLAIQGRFSDSPYWMIRRPGLLGPELPWERCES